MNAIGFHNTTDAGFVTVTLDLPFGVGVPSAEYLVRDPKFGVALIRPILRHGSRAFFRNVQITEITSFDAIKLRAEQSEPDKEPSYLVTSVMGDDSEIPTLNIRCGDDGGFAEAKFFSEVQITFLEQMLKAIEVEGYVIARVAEILNPFLDKYRLLTEDYRVTHVADDRNFYLAACCRATVILTPLRH